MAKEEGKIEVSDGVLRYLRRCRIGLIQGRDTLIGIGNHAMAEMTKIRIETLDMVIDDLEKLRKR